jgi:putative NADH-flavin reductase
MERQMRIVVLGATGGTGTQVIRQAMEAGHEVVPVVRDPARLTVPDARPVAADVLDPDALAPVLFDAGAVVSALGPRRGEKSRVLTAGARSTLAAMSKAGVTRLVIVSASGFFQEDGDGALTRVVIKPMLQRLLRDGVTDTRGMEALVTSSDTDWTIMRPPRLTDGPRRRAYRTVVDGHAGTTIARADLADAILRAIADPATIRHRIGVAY